LCQTREINKNQLKILKIVEGHLIRKNAVIGVGCLEAICSINLE
jgi:hypothetical protein